MEDPLNGGHGRQVLRITEGIHAARLEREVLLAHVLGRNFILNELVYLDEPRKPAGVWDNLRHHRLRIDLLPVLVHLRET